MATILVVDDLEANRAFLVMLLRHYGHRLLEAADGREALGIARSEHPDLVITDVLMPTMDGYELVRQLRLEPSTAAIPVIFSTAHYGEREARELALSSGVAHVLTKPSEPEDVLAAVNRVLSGKAAVAGGGDTTPLTAEFDREHLRLLTNKLSENTEELKAANARLRALINVGLELAAERDSDRLLQNVCLSARDLFGATYVTLGILDRESRTLQRLVTSGGSGTDWLRAGDAAPGILATAIANRRAMRGENPGGAPMPLGLPAHHPAVHSFLVAPVASPALVYGWIFLAGNDGRAFAEDDEQLVLALSGQVGRIYENGYFYSIAQRRAQELELEIIERKHAEAELRESEGRYRTLFNYAPDGIVIADSESNYIDANPSICQMLGYPREMLIGLNASDIVAPTELSHIEPALRTIESAADYQREWLFRRRDGSTFPAEVLATKMPDGRLMGMIRDVTERSRALEALRSAEERMRFVLDAAHVGIWDLDYTTGRLAWPAAIEQMYGVPAGTFAGTFEAFMERIHPEDRPALLATLEQATKTGGDFTTEHRVVWPDGSVRWISGAGRVLLGSNGEPVRAVGIALDATDRRTLEAQFHQSQKMEAVGRLAGGVAHDFNNLLTAILGYCGLILDDLNPSDPLRGDITEIQKAGTSAAALTRQLLAFSRKQIIEPTLLDLNAIVSSMRGMLGRLIGEDVAVSVALHPSPVRFTADRGQVEQILLNLAVNARDAMPAGGSLTIETANVDLDDDYANSHFEVKPGPYVVLTVTDTGTGMTPEVQARLFEPFFTTKEQGKGTGLGLATVHGIVARIGGSIGVYSELGTGTSFNVYFPRTDSTEVIAEAPLLASPKATGAHTVLVVEDAAGLRELTRRILDRQGYRVLLAANAADALRLFAQDPSIDVLLTDIVMPGASGPEVAKQLVEQRPSLIVIYMSGYTEEAIVHHGVLKPGIAFLHKPFTADALGRKINEAIASSRG